MKFVIIGTLGLLQASTCLAASKAGVKTGGAVAKVDKYCKTFQIMQGYKGSTIDFIHKNEQATDMLIEKYTEVSMSLKYLDSEDVRETYNLSRTEVKKLQRALRSDPGIVPKNRRLKTILDSIKKDDKDLEKVQDAFKKCTRKVVPNVEIYGYGVYLNPIHCLLLKENQIEVDGRARVTRDTRRSKTSWVESGEVVTVLRVTATKVYTREYGPNFGFPKDNLKPLLSRGIIENMLSKLKEAEVKIFFQNFKVGDRVRIERSVPWWKTGEGYVNATGKLERYYSTKEEHSGWRVKFTKKIGKVDSIRVSQLYLKKCICTFRKCICKSKKYQNLRKRVTSAFKKKGLILKNTVINWTIKEMLKEVKSQEWLNRRIIIEAALQKQEADARRR